MYSDLTQQCWISFCCPYWRNPSGAEIWSAWPSSIKFRCLKGTVRNNWFEDDGDEVKEAAHKWPRIQPPQIKCAEKQGDCTIERWYTSNHMHAVFTATYKFLFYLIFAFHLLKRKHFIINCTVYWIRNRTGIIYRQQRVLLLWLYYFNISFTCSMEYIQPVMLLLQYVLQCTSISWAAVASSIILF
jgi:hypothetical protein